jgi:hypothetical protein
MLYLSLVFKEKRVDGWMDGRKEGRKGGRNLRKTKVTTKERSEI